MKPALAAALGGAAGFLVAGPLVHSIAEGGAAEHDAWVQGLPPDTQALYGTGAELVARTDAHYGSPARAAAIVAGAAIGYAIATRRPLVGLLGLAAGWTLFGFLDTRDPFVGWRYLGRQIA